MPGGFWSLVPELSKLGLRSWRRREEVKRKGVPGEAAARAPAHPVPGTLGFLWDSQSAVEIYPRLLRRWLGLQGAIQKGFKQPRAPEKIRAPENRTQTQLNRLSELRTYIFN